MTGIEVRRWKRYGHDRAYAVARDGMKLGWMNLVDGTVTIEKGADALATTVALHDWNACQLEASDTPLVAEPEDARAAIAEFFASPELPIDVSGNQLADGDTLSPIPRLFKRAYSVLGPEHVEAIYAVTRRSTMWR